MSFCSDFPSASYAEASLGSGSAALPCMPLPRGAFLVPAATPPCHDAQARPCQVARAACGLAEISRCHIMGPAGALRRPSPSNRRHPVRLAPFACSKLQAMDIYPFEGQGLPTITAGTAAKKAARPTLPPGDPAVPSPRAAKDAAVSGPSRSGFAPYIPLNGAKPCRKEGTQHQDGHAPPGRPLQIP